VRFRKYQIFAAVLFWAALLYKYFYSPILLSCFLVKLLTEETRGDKNGPPFLRKLSARLSRRLTVWQTSVITLLGVYVARNFDKITGLESPEPLANLYSRSYFRATWITTALDAGFWTAMRIRNNFSRNLLSMVFSVYYLICAEQADVKVRKVRGALTVDHLRVSWNKPTTPYLKFLNSLMRPRLTRYPPRAIRIPRPKSSSYSDPVLAWLYFDGPVSELKNHDKIVLDIPGGGFVAMSPRTHDDRLLAWAGKTGLPVLSLDYRKAPEWPYPYALNECYDTYHTLIASHGRCIGLGGEFVPKIVISGDSAGGNLAVGTMLMILQANTTSERWQGARALPVPEGLVLIYPALDVNIGNWMTEEQMDLIKDRHSKAGNKAILSRKSQDYRQLTPRTPHHSDDEDDQGSPPKGLASIDSKVTVVLRKTDSDLTPRPSAAHISDAKPAASADVNGKPQVLKTRLAMSSMISYFNDRILTPEMMRAMIVLYIGPHNRPDFSTDYLLSPLLAPDALLAEFPKTYILTGERDPLVDDTVIFAGRLRQAAKARWLERVELGIVRGDFLEESIVEVVLVPGISHGFLQFAGIFPDGWKYIYRCAEWIAHIFHRSDLEDHYDEFDGLETDGSERTERPWFARQRSQTWDGRRRYHPRPRKDSSGEEDRPLEMTRMSGSPSGFSKGKHRSEQSSLNLQSSAKEGRPNGASDQQARSSGKPRPPPLKTVDKGKGKGKGKAKSKKKGSITSMPSEDDLLKRRMKGMASSLMGLGEDGPPTP
jgi:acetyl esterase/lipase